MTQTIETTVYEYDELPTSAAKEKARQWAYEGVFDDDWWDCLYDDAKTIGLKITSFDLDRNRHAKGEFITSAPECAETIIAKHGKDCETYKTAQAYLERMAQIGDRPSNSDENADDSSWEDETYEADQQFLAFLLQDYANTLQKESEYMGSTEYLEEGIRANEYTFTESGTRFG